MLGGHRSAEIQDIWCPPGRPTLHNPSHRPCGMDTISGYANSSASWKTQKMIFRKKHIKFSKEEKQNTQCWEPLKKIHLLGHWFLQKSIIHLFFIYIYLVWHQSLDLQKRPRKNPTKVLHLETAIADAFAFLRKLRALLGGHLFGLLNRFFVRDVLYMHCSHGTLHIHVAYVARIYTYTTYLYKYCIYD